MSHLLPRMERILAHADNGKPITREWLDSIGVFGGVREISGPYEREAVFMVTEGEKGNETVFRNELPEIIDGVEVTVIGINLTNMRPYIETWEEEVIILPPISTRLEFRLLLLSLKAWGYIGD